MGRAYYHYTTTPTLIILFQAVYKCEEGYYLTDGDLTRNCTEYGTWSGKHPVCSSNSAILLYLKMFSNQLYNKEYKISVLPDH